MLTRGVLVNFVSRTCIISMAHLMLVIVPLAALIGCSGEGEGGPVISSLSTPADAMAGPSSDLAPGSTGVHQAGQEHPIASPPSDATTDFTSNPAPDSIYDDDPPPRSASPDEEPVLTVTSTPKGVTVRLYWQHSSDANIFGYYVYYGKQPAQESGSCSAYEANQAVDAPPATITGLEHDTLYFFAVKKFNESENACSDEIIVTTPPAET